jgi:hypothetical protein
LRVITKASPRGCGVFDWNCMSNICTTDLGPTAWRGWAACDPHNDDFICYFDCNQVQELF